MHEPQAVFREIDLDDHAQVQKLCFLLECSEVDLREAVRMVGPRQISVEQWIRGLNSN